jgi:hypothetical protein
MSQEHLPPDLVAAVANVHTAIADVHTIYNNLPIETQILHPFSEVFSKCKSLLLGDTSAQPNSNTPTPHKSADAPAPSPADVPTPHKTHLQSDPISDENILQHYKDFTDLYHKYVDIYIHSKNHLQVLPIIFSLYRHLETFYAKLSPLKKQAFPLPTSLHHAFLLYKSKCVST